jgi:eukaryotic-like serine/threonine-protein kinase
MSDPKRKPPPLPQKGRAPAEAAPVSDPPVPVSEMPTQYSAHEEGERPSKLKVVTIAPATSIPPESQIVDPDSRDPLIGCIIDGRYQIEKTLGEGGMGVVYRGRHKIVGKQIAMKVLRADLARDSEVTERFLNEAKSASAIGNPHIIDISDFGQLPDGSTYFIMEFLDGIPLSQVIEGGKPVPVPRIVQIARQLAEGLAAAHRANIVHRDLKPDNIFLVTRGSTKDFVKILDFGIAKVSTAEGKLTRAGQVFGTPHYMSPEQAAGAPVDHRGDIYSLGVILYELASGRVPFDADNFMGILTQHMYKAPVPIRALVPQPQEVPPGLEAIVLKCLSKRPEQRYQSMEELIADFDKLDHGVIPDAVPEMMQRSGGFNVPADYFKSGGPGQMPAPVPATPEPAPRAASRWPLWAGVAGVLTAVGIVVAIFARSAPTPAAPEPTAAEPPAATTEAPAVTPTPAAPKLTQVVLAVQPLDAHVFDGDEDLGTSPVVLQVAPESPRTLEIRREGYVTQSIEIDATQPKRSIKLEEQKTAAVRPTRTTQKAAPQPAADKPKPKPKPTGGGEIVNPWGD